MEVSLVMMQEKMLYTTPKVGDVIDITSNIISDALNDLFFK